MINAAGRPASAPVIEPFVSLVGGKRWRERLAEIRDLAAAGPRASQAIRQRHVLELAWRSFGVSPAPAASVTEALLGAIASRNRADRRAT